jgi:hypothetical protein
MPNESEWLTKNLRKDAQLKKHTRTCSDSMNSRRKGLCQSLSETSSSRKVHDEPAVKLLERMQTFQPPKT